MNSVECFDAHKLEIAVERADVGRNVVGKLVHEVEPVRIVIVLGDKSEFAVDERADHVVFMRVIQPERLCDVACRFFPLCWRNVMAFQGDAIHGLAFLKG